MRPLSIAFLLFLASTLSAEPRPLSTASPGLTDFPNGAASVVPTGYGFLTAWVVETPAGPRVDALRLDHNGVRLTETAQVVIDGARSAKLVRLGGKPLLVYWDLQYFARYLWLHENGEPRAELDLGEATSRNTPIVMVSGDGSRLLAIQYGGDITATIVDAEGRIIRAGIFLASDTNQLGSFAPLTDRFAVIRRASGSPTVWLRQLTGDGVLETTGIVIDAMAATGPLGPVQLAGVSDGNRMIAWWPTADGTTMEGAVIADGVVTRTLTIRRDVNRLAPRQLIPDGDGFLLLSDVVESTGIRSVHIDRLGPDGLPAASDPVRLPIRGFTDAALNGTTLFMTSSTGTSSSGYAVKVGASLNLLREESLSVLPARQSAPAVATDGTTSLVVWRETSLGSYRIRAAIMNARGEAVTPAQTLRTAYTSDARVVYGGGLYLVVWREPHHDQRSPVVAMRVLPNGAVLDREPFRIGVQDRSDHHGFEGPAAGWNGDTFLVAWNGSISEYEPAFMTATVTTAGTVGPAHSIRGMNGFEIEATLGWNGTNFVLAYTRIIQSSGFPGTWSDVEAVPLTRNGIQIGDSRIVIRQSMSPSIASDGDRFLLTTESREVLDSTANLHLTRVPTVWGTWLTKDGMQAGETFPIATTAAALLGTSMSDVVWTGSEFDVTGWRQTGNAWRLWRMSLTPQSWRWGSTPSATPDRTAPGPTIGTVMAGGAPMVVTTEVRNDNGSGGSSRILIRTAIEEEVPRRRAVRR